LKVAEVYQLIRIKIQKTRDYYKRHGLWKLILLFFDLSGVFKKKVLIFFELELKDSVSGQKNDDDIDLVRVEKEDIEHTPQYFDGWFKKDKALKRLEEGRVLFAVKDEEQRIFYQWVEFEKVDIPFLDLSFFVPDETAYITYMYTVPEYRGKGIASKGKLLVLKYLRDCGYRRILVVIQPHNAASRRVNKKVGFNEYQTVIYLKFLFLKYYCVKDYDTSQKKVSWHIREIDQELWKTFSKIWHE
jgi:RimJ/RimL family protein N-acetyltransferase